MKMKRKVVKLTTFNFSTIFRPTFRKELLIVSGCPYLKASIGAYALACRSTVALTAIFVKRENSWPGGLTIKAFSRCGWHMWQSKKRRQRSILVLKMPMEVVKYQINTAAWVPLQRPVDRPDSRLQSGHRDQIQMRYVDANCTVDQLYDDFIFIEIGQSIGLPIQKSRKIDCNESVEAFSGLSKTSSLQLTFSLSLLFIRIAMSHRVESENFFYGGWDAKNK